MNPIISICIPTFERPQYLNEALKSIATTSVLNQNVEVIITDNSPSALTKSVVDMYNDLIQIRYYENDSNIGAIKNVFKALSLAKGDFLWMFSDDDVVVEGAVERVLGFISSHHDIDYIFLPRKLVDINLSAEVEIVQPSGVDVDMFFLNGKELFGSCNGQLPGIMGYLCSTVIRRNLWNQCSPKFGEPTGGLHHLKIILSAIHDRKCAILKDPSVLCRLENGRELSSKVWFDEYIKVYKHALKEGYSKSLCEYKIRETILSFSKTFVMDKARINRNDNILQVVKGLNVSYLLPKQFPWYYLSFLPAKFLNFLMKSFFKVRLIGVRLNIL